MTTDHRCSPRGAAQARFVRCLLPLVPISLLLPGSGWARPAIRSAFFTVYPSAVGTQLDNLPSNSGHCGVCHYDFNGGGPRNPFGAGVEAGRNSGLTSEQAVRAMEPQDPDGDGATCLTEILGTGYTNVPTFPGLSQANKTNTTHVALADIEPYLTPITAPDVTPPVVHVNTPNGGEILAANGIYSVGFTATDANGIAAIHVDLSLDGGTTFKPLAKNLPASSSYAWFVPNLPGSSNRLRVRAVDNSGNVGQDLSDASFTITARPPGLVPTTLRDIELPGTQPNEGAVLDDPQTACLPCHGGYDTANEPWANWKGSMMANAARDPLFFAAVAISEQDAPSSGDLCIRCHSPGGWQEGRSVDTSGGLLTAKDRQSVQCDFCHRIVDRNYVAGMSPAQDPAVLSTVNPLPLQYGNGQFIQDPAVLRRGPFADATATHSWVASPIHVSSNLCGTCHDVSNPVFQRTAPGDYAPNGFDVQHADMNLRDMLPIERTFSEWSQSTYANGGVYAPEFAGNKPDGMVSTCQDCHLRNVNAKGANDPAAPLRPDLPLHDMTGGNTFIPDVLPSLYGTEVNAVQLQAGKARALSMLQKAATLTVTPQDFGVVVRVTNETAHKLPSGYPEGRRIWLNVRATDAAGESVYESGAYDAATARLIPDTDAKVYEIHPGLSPSLAAALGLPAGPSFHFVLNDTIYLDNRIPPRGFTNAAFEAVQSPAIGHAYADGQYWDETTYNLPAAAESVTVTLYYQTTSKEFVEFLRDANTTNNAGQVLYDAWVAQGKSAPVVMRKVTVPVRITVDTADNGGHEPPLTYSLVHVSPNPFRLESRLAYTLPQRGRVHIGVYDVRGREVRRLVDRVMEPGRYDVTWNGRDENGAAAASGVYMIRYQAGSSVLVRRTVLLR